MGNNLDLTRDTQLLKKRENKTKSCSHKGINILWSSCGRSNFL
jgi:hypothetical protein